MFYAHYQYLSPNPKRKRKKGTVVHNFQRMLNRKELILPDSKIKFLDTQTGDSLKKQSFQISSYLHKFSNEPSLGLFRVREHVVHKVPLLAQKLERLEFLRKITNDRLFETKYAIGAAKHTYKTRIPLRSIRNKLKMCLYGMPPASLEDYEIKQMVDDEEDENNIENLEVDDDFNIENVKKSLEKEKENIKERVQKNDKEFSEKIKAILNFDYGNNTNDDIQIEYQNKNSKL